MTNATTEQVSLRMSADEIAELQEVQPMACAQSLRSSLSETIRVTSRLGRQVLLRRMKRRKSAPDGGQAA